MQTTIPNKELAIKQLKHIVSILTVVAQKKLALDMTQWVGPIDQLEGHEHPCRTAACVCGWVADAEIPEDIFPRGHRAVVSDDGINWVANRVSADLRSSLGHSLAESVYAAHFGDRLGGARSLFTDIAERKDFAHLFSHQPSVQDALEYINAMIVKLQED